MFYSIDLLRKKGGKFGIIWKTATLKKVSKNQVFSVNISETCEDLVNYIIERKNFLRFSLYLSSQLIFGVVYIYNRQAHYLLGDVILFVDSMRFKPALEIEPKSKKRVYKDTITDPLLGKTINFEWRENIEIENFSDDKWFAVPQLDSCVFEANTVDPREITLREESIEVQQNKMPTDPLDYLPIQQADLIDVFPTMPIDQNDENKENDPNIFNRSQNIIIDKTRKESSLLENIQLHDEITINAPIPSSVPLTPQKIINVQPSKPLTARKLVLGDVDTSLENILNKKKKLIWDNPHQISQEKIQKQLDDTISIRRKITSLGIEQMNKAEVLFNIFLHDSIGHKLGKYTRHILQYNKTASDATTTTKESSTTKSMTSELGRDLSNQSLPNLTNISTISSTAIKTSQQKAKHIPILYDSMIQQPNLETSHLPTEIELPLSPLLNVAANRLQSELPLSPLLNGAANRRQSDVQSIMDFDETLANAIEESVKDGKTLTFKDICPVSSSKAVAAFTFYCLLESAKKGVCRLQQCESFGQIMILK